MVTMNLKPGIFLKSTAALSNSYFSDVIIYIAEYNSRGAVGFIISRPYSRSLNQLEEFKYVPYFPIYEGGPVDQEHIFILHKRPDLVEGGALVADGVYYGGDFSQVVDTISSGSLNSEHIKIFIGYCGWNEGELEAEINEGSWNIMDGKASDIFLPYLAN
jgi:putative transcriptional regulator